MADTKLTALTAIGTPALEDLIYLVDDPSGTPISKKSTLAQIAPIAGQAQSYGSVFTAPVDGDYAWINQGGASIASTNGGLFLRAPIASAASLRIRKKAAPAAPYTITAAFIPTLVSLNFQSLGLCFRQASDGKLATFEISAATNTLAITSNKYTDATNFSATYVSRGFYQTGPVWWMRIADNNTNRICSFSFDGVNFIAFHSVTRTDFLTADEVGFFANDQTNAYETGLTLLSWVQA